MGLQRKASETISKEPGVAAGRKKHHLEASGQDRGLEQHWRSASSLHQVFICLAKQRPRVLGLRLKNEFSSDGQSPCVYY
jgi:hypothetical protein